MSRPGYDAVLLDHRLSRRSMRGRWWSTSSPRSRARSCTRSSSPKFAEQARAASREALPAEPRPRSCSIEGDAAAMDLGLSGAEFRQLTREVDRIHHVAHVSYAGVDRRSSPSSLNVVGRRRDPRVRARLRLARVPRLPLDRARLGRSHRRRLRRRPRLRPGLPQRRRGDAHARRGARAPRHARRARSRSSGPPRSSATSSTGEFDRLDGLYLLVLIVVRRRPTSPSPSPARATRRSTSSRSTSWSAPRTPSAARPRRPGARSTSPIRNPLSARTRLRPRGPRRRPPHRAQPHPLEPGQGAPSHAGHRALHAQPARLRGAAHASPCATTRATPIRSCGRRHRLPALRVVRRAARPASCRSTCARARSAGAKTRWSPRSKIRCPDCW